MKDECLDSKQSLIAIERNFIFLSMVAECRVERSEVACSETLGGGGGDQGRDKSKE